MNIKQDNNQYIINVYSINNNNVEISAQLNLTDIDVNINKTIVHNTLIDGDINNYHIGEPVFLVETQLDNKIYSLERQLNNNDKYPLYKYIEINNNNSTINFYFDEIIPNNKDIAYVTTTQSLLYYYSNNWYNLNVGNIDITNDKYNTSLIMNYYGEIFNCKNNIALGDYSHAEGNSTSALGNNSHAEGSNTTASGNLNNIKYLIYYNYLNIYYHIFI